MNTWTFVFSSLIIIVIPGTGVVYTVSNGLTKGRKASILAAIGCTAGIIPHLCASIALSSLLTRMNEQVFGVIKLAGALYLLWLGAGMLFSKSKLEFTGVQANESAIAIIRQGILINLLNPKLTLFFFSFLPQYVSAASKNYVGEAFLYGFSFMLMTFIVFAGYGMLAGLASSLITKSPKRLLRIRQLFGIIFIVFAIQLGISSL